MELHQRDEPTRPRTVGILLYDSVEVLDFSGPYEVFVSARPDGQGDDSPALFDLMTVAEERRLVQCNGGLRVQPDCTIDDDQRSEEHTSELQSRQYLVCRLLLEKKKKK